jgi:predicted RNase H-like nuclease (RuvC/YqgF family)
MGATLLVAIAAVVVAPLVGYLAASRKLSGKIGTSDADALWNESKEIRADYRLQLDEANRRLVKCEGRIAQVEGLNSDLIRENLALQRRIDVLERENAELRGQVKQLLEQLHEERADA